MSKLTEESVRIEIEDLEEVVGGAGLNTIRNFTPVQQSPLVVKPLKEGVISRGGSINAFDPGTCPVPNPSGPHTTCMCLKPGINTQILPGD
jgi:hypothetical protein